MRKHLYLVIVLLSLFTACRFDDSHKTETTPDPITLKQIHGIAFLCIESPKVTQELCASVIDTVNKATVPSLAFVYGICGQSDMCLRMYTASNIARKHVIRVYAVDETHRDGDGEWIPGRLWKDESARQVSDRFEKLSDLDDYYDRLTEMTSVLEGVSNPNTVVKVVPFLEGNMSAQAGINAAFFTKDNIPDEWEVSLNPLHPGTFTGEFKRESHGKNVSAGDGTSILSQDGAVFTPQETEDYFSENTEAEEIYVWPYELQGLTLVNGNLVKPSGPIPDRTLTFMHEEEYSNLFSKFK
jgi:hypothetical protein